MKKLIPNITLAIFLLIGLMTCEEPSSKNIPTTKDSISKNTTNKAPAPKPQIKECEINGEILEGNRKLVKDLQTIICIVADSTAEKNHRVLEVYDAQTCELIKREVMPIEFKVSFPYRIADIIYNKNSHLVAMKSYQKVYCYDVEQQQLLPAMVPDFLNERMAVDAQSGTIKHLEVWENYLIGFVQDGGAFVFDVSDTENAKALLPAAEYDLSFGEGEDFSSLFFLKSENGNTYQAILPSYDYDEGKFHVNALFEAPEQINASLPKSISNNQFIVLKNQKGMPIAIDMGAQKNVALPDQIKNQSTQEILKFLKKK